MDSSDVMVVHCWCAQAKVWLSFAGPAGLVPETRAGQLYSWSVSCEYRFEDFSISESIERESYVARMRKSK